MLDTTYYACKLQNSNYSWVTLKSWEYEFGECPSNNTKRITKQAPNGDYYYCNKGLWSRASLEYFIGTCSKRSEVVKDTVFNGVEYICDSSQVGDNDEWHRMTAADSAGGFCNRALVGKMMAFDDTVYACASIDVFNRTAFTQEEMKANIVKAKKIWVIASISENERVLIADLTTSTFLFSSALSSLTALSISRPTTVVPYSERIISSISYCSPCL